MVEGTGQFSVRGGIADIFPPNCESPLRIEYWGNDIDTISVFDTDTQRRTDMLSSARIAPATEVLFDSDADFCDTALALAASLRGKSAEKVRLGIEHDAEDVKSGLRISSLDRYLPVAYERTACVFDYMDDALVFVGESSAVKERAVAANRILNEDIKALLEGGILAKPISKFMLAFTELQALYEREGAIYLDNFTRGSFDTPVKELVTFNIQQLSPWDGTLSVLLDDIRPAMSRNVTVIVTAGTEKAAKGLEEALENEDIPAAYFPVPPAEFSLKRVNILSGALSNGFLYPNEKYMLITYGRASHSATSRKRKVFKAADSVESLEELVRGDYVVHAVHGIGVFDGINKMEVGGLTKDYIRIKYDKGDVLYVPVTQLDLIAKYIGPHSEEKTLKLNRIGGKEWEKTKSRVRGAVKDMAKELIALYSKRLNTEGYPFSPDIDMQSDFERRFEFDETDDQLKSVDEIKYDMEQPHPMDRLLCGDVGFGKTEVALRAAFKCVADGKQCAILVPTTILALQHYQTIMRRFDGFPIEGEMISRFRSPKEQKKLLTDLKRGKIDVLVGTHRLISKDVEFHDLGLLIVDEEQRFGVAQKEKLKELFPTVDCLTLSATPIPRTMNMAMSGIRDMSVIEEAPQDRFPVQTYVLEHDFGILCEAMRKELRRGGQVYYLYNRVETIEKVAAKIREEIPEARIAVGHGKMGEDELSTIWRSLLEGEIDILVCTTIIETGVDVPNANTLIIEDADNMGLSQLHQIRGRVGRSTRRAFAYFTYRRNKELSEIAAKRLDAIRDYTEFGSGFKIAMRDLEIRGAGNLLGSQQHGHLESVGYDMYMRLLSEAVSEEKGEKPQRPEKECLVDIQLDAHIPEEYIESLAQRIYVYKRIADIRDDDDAADVLDELIDRYGEPPASVAGLIEISLLRNTASFTGVYEIGQKGNSILLYTSDIDMRTVSALGQLMRGRILVSAGNKPYISVKKLDRESPLTTIKTALTVMKGCKEAEIKKAELAKAQNSPAPGDGKDDAQ